MEQLSTGKRINSSADDVAGLAISTRLTSQIRGLNQAIRNVNDGISMLQTADGAAESVLNMLQRMRELTTQHGNDTNNQRDKEAIQLEISSLKNEIIRTTNATTWNEMKILNGSGGDGNGNLSLQIGANNSQQEKISFRLPKLLAESNLLAEPNSLAELSNSSSTVPSGTVYWDPAVGGNGHSYRFVSDPNVNWDVAQQAANSSTVNGYTGYVMTITSQAELDFLENSVIPGGPNSDNVYTSGHLVSGSTSQWQWTAGPEAGNIFWDAGPVSGQFSTWLPWQPMTGAGATTYPVVSINGYFQPVFAQQDGLGPYTVGYVIEYSGNIGGNQSTDPIDISPITLPNIDTDIANIDTDIQAVSKFRSEIGARVSQLNFTVDDLATSSINLQTSRSRIQDTDYSAATTELAKRNIIQQAAQAMLAQANQQPQVILQLLKSTS